MTLIDPNFKRVLQFPHGAFYSPPPPPFPLIRHERVHIKVEGPKTKEFTKEDSTDAVVFRWDAKEQKNKGTRNKNI